MRSTRGISLLLTMVWLLVFASIAYVVVLALYTNTHQANLLTHRDLCQLASDRMLETVNYQLQQNPRFGLSGQRTLVEKSEDGVEACLTFDRQEAARREVPWSVNNMEGETSVAGWKGSVVPAQSVHVVISLKSGSVRKTVDALFRVPRFPYAIASSGSVQSTGGLLVAAVPEGAAMSGSIGPALLRPGHLLSDSTDANAISLVGPNIRVTGNLRTPGGARVGGGAVVEGFINERSSREALPALDIPSYDPINRPLMEPLEEVYGSLELKGFARREGNLVLTGDLQLEDAVLYVNGNLTVQGPIFGRGAVFVNGTCTMRGAASVASDSVCALVSQGDVTVTGNGRDRSYFHGLVYTEGNFVARDVTVVGSLVANSARSGGSRVRMDNVAVVYDSRAVAFEMNFPFDNEVTPERKGPTSNLRFLGPTLNSFFDPASDRYTTAATSAQLADAIGSSMTVRLSNGRMVSQTEFLRTVGRADPPEGFASWSDYLGDQKSQLVARMLLQLDAIAKQYAEGRDTALRQGRFRLDLNEFFSPGDRVRVVARRNLN